MTSHDDSGRIQRSDGPAVEKAGLPRMGTGELPQRPIGGRIRLMDGSEPAADGPLMGDGTPATGDDRPPQEERRTATARRPESYVRLLLRASGGQVSVVGASAV